MDEIWSFLWSREARKVVSLETSFLNSRKLARILNRVHKQLTT
jgi:hypothetical protein